MPTRNRREFVPRAIRQFLEQDYPSRELIVLDDGGEAVSDLIPADPRIRYERLDRPVILGDKRNLAAERARGEVLVHWDDDDWMASWRLSYQVGRLLTAGVDACGLNRVCFHAPASGQAWEYTYAGQEPWLVGGTLCYTRSFWHGHRFASLGEGEDNDFLWRHRPRVLVLPDTSFYVATVHPANSSRKATSSASYRPLSVEQLPFWSASVAEPPPEPPRDAPLVSCLMATGGRKDFAAQAIRYFLRQTYPRKELVIVDDGSDDLESMIPADDRIVYLKASGNPTLGAKMNLAIERSQGSLLAHWDDDDWYSPHRLVIQVNGLLREGSDVCSPVPEIVYQLDRDQFWRCGPEVRKLLFFKEAVLGAALLYRRRVWGDGGARHPDTTMAEDMYFVRDVLERGGKLATIEHAGSFVYVRHGKNTWRFHGGQELGGPGWEKIPPPCFVPLEDLDFYRSQRGGNLALPPPRPVHAPPARLPVPFRGPGLRPAGAVIRRVLF